MSITRTTRAGRVASAFAALLLGATLVAGCGSSDEPEPQQSRQNADEPDDDPERPEQDNKRQKADNLDEKTGATADQDADEPKEYTFVKEYVAAINEVKKGGDSSELLDMSTEDCQTCDYMAKYHQDVYDNGGEYTGDPAIEVLELVDGPAGSDPRILRVETREPRIEIIEQADGPAIPVQAGTILNDFELSKEGGRWKVSEFCEVTEGQPPGCMTP